MDSIFSESEQNIPHLITSKISTQSLLLILPEYLEFVKSKNFIDQKNLKKVLEKISKVQLERNESFVDRKFENLFFFNKGDLYFYKCNT